MHATYSYNRRLQPSTMRVTHTNGTVVLLDLTYSYLQGSVNNGNVVSITNNLSTGRTQSFTYDELNRLKTAQSQATSGTHCWGQSYGYDRYGNLLTTTVTKCSAPAPCYSLNSGNQLYKTCSEGSQTLFYDVAGNLTNDHGVTYTWNAEGRVASTAGVTYTYDGDGRRVKKSNGKLYWYGLSGEVLTETDLAGNTITDYIYFQGRRIARRDAAGAVYYFFSDHLGSARVITNSTGAIQRESDFYPFGEERVVSGTLDDPNKFAGMYYDTESALYHTLYGHYSPTLGRWLSPDPVRCCEDDPQAFDRYTYILDNPTNLTDPFGLQPCNPFTGDPDREPGPVDVVGLPGCGRHNAGVAPSPVDCNCILTGG